MRFSPTTRLARYWVSGTRKVIETNNCVERITGIDSKRWFSRMTCEYWELSSSTGGRVKFRTRKECDPIRATGNQHIAVRQQRGGMAVARNRHAARRCEQAGDRIVEFRRIVY